MHSCATCSPPSQGLGGHAISPNAQRRRMLFDVRILNSNFEWLVDFALVTGPIFLILIILGLALRRKGRK